MTDIVERLRGWSISDCLDAADEIERLRRLLFRYGAMDDPPCFACGYNGPGYYQPDIHPCAVMHHEATGDAIDKRVREALGDDDRS